MPDTVIATSIYVRRILFWFLLFLWIYAPLVRAQSVQDTLQRVRAEYPVHASAAQTGELLTRVATLHPGWGVHAKTSGETCPMPDGRTINCSILVSPTLDVFDVLGHAAGSGNNSFPQWTLLGKIDSPNDFIVPTPGTPAPNPPVDYEPRIAALERDLDGLSAFLNTAIQGLSDRIAAEADARLRSDRELAERLDALDARTIPARCIVRAWGIPIACRLEP